jgi:cell wall-associated NlpC family hydrolase
MMPMAPLSLDEQAFVGDAPLEDNGDIPVPLSLISRSEALAPVIIPATIAGERVLLRGGPGVEYDAIGRMSADTPLQVMGYFGDWFKVRERAGKPEFWISGELLNIPENAIYTLFEVQASEIPAPPPPKIAMVRETGLALRDGPGTNYVSMTTFQSGTQLDLLERYEDWFHVGIPGGGDGWVKGQFLDMTPGMIERLLVAETIPDPNPAMIGAIADNSVNLRKGPDSKYAKVGVVNAGLQVDIVGKHKDWFKIKLPEGNVAWVFSDLLNASAHVVRRVPVTKDFPALPVKPAATRAGRVTSGGASANLASVPASGDVASYAVQFNGSRYVYGGASPRGFDCSGLTSYIYRQFGVNLPHSAAAQFSTKYGASVGSMDNLAPGDLVFFVGTTGRRGITHVAMYIGGGRIIHAMTPRLGVQVSSINERYWVNHYYGAIRVRR